MKKVLIAALPVAAAVAFGVGIASSDGVVTAQRHSCGYKCNPDGSAATPSAPPQQTPAGTVTDVQPAGRTNPHSGGREGGAANKRVGHPGGPNHPNDVIIGSVADAQLMDFDPSQKIEIQLVRTDVHSGGHDRPRHGGGGHSLSGGRY